MSRRDRGAASILVLAMGLVLVAAGMAGVAVGAARVARHEARTAADLGALAGAARVMDGDAAACAEAARYVTANSARMTSCELHGREVVVHVEKSVVLMRHITRRAQAAARAGPVSVID
jgi:secretion/DNA translocation related TadE-like protein